MGDRFSGLAAAIKEELEAIPQTMRQDEVSRQVILLVLSNALKGMGLIPVPAWKPPKSTRDRIDLVGVKPDTNPPEVEAAFAADPLVELAKLKAMEWVQCPHKVVITFSQRKDKVEQSTFFLSSEHEHFSV